MKRDAVVLIGFIAHRRLYLEAMPTLAAVLCVLLSEGAAAVAQQVIVHQAENTDPAPGPLGTKPYEMAGRQEDRVPLVVFADLSGWEVEGSNAEGWLYLSQDQRLYRDHCAKLVYVGRGSDPALLVRLKKPMAIAEPWDCVNFWNYGNNANWHIWQDKSTPSLHVFVVVRDAAGRQFDIQMGMWNFINYRYWFMMHGRLLSDQLEKLEGPAEFVGFRFKNAGNTEKRTIYLGPCYFYKEELKPLVFAPWPEKLPFPTRAETILPANKTAEFENTARREGEATVFSYRGDDCALEYRYVPTSGTLGDIELRYKDQVVRPCAGGGIQLAGGAGPVPPGDASIRATLKEQQLAGGVLKVVWRLQSGEVGTEVEYRLGILQKSLIVEMAAGEPVVERVTLGWAEPISKGKLFKIPYLTYRSDNDPHALYAGGLFFFNHFDWYYSDASELYGAAGLEANRAIYNGGARYIPKTDGRRNYLRERLFITASADFQEILPTIPNPKSPMREVQYDRLWRYKGGSDYQAEIAEATRLRKFGCDKVTIRYHEATWRDGYESFTFRLEAAPGRGGDAALKNLVASVKALGWRVGLYTNYTDFAPVNKYWNEDRVSRRSDGGWQPAWKRCYGPKPMWAVEMEARLAPQIHAEFGTNHSYCDVHTCLPPFDRVDYDARVPGAGTFRRTFECYGRLLYNERLAHEGPVYSEGAVHWLYAGLTDGNYGQIWSDAPWQDPLLVDFDLLKIHPLQMDAGMGLHYMFFKGAEPNLDHVLAATVAYGHIGLMAERDLPGLLKIYYMMQQVQKRYAMVPVWRIQYEEEGKLVYTSRALVSGAYRNNRVHVVYENGTEVYVNGFKDPWTVEVGGRRFELPTWGYLVWRAEDGLLAYSALVCVAGPKQKSGPRQRVDCSLGTGQFYADSRGGFVFLGPLALEGSAAFKKDYGTWWVIPTTKCTDFAFAPGLAAMDDDKDVEVIGQAEDGSAVGSPKLRWSRGLLHVIPTSEAGFKYKVGKVDRSRPPVVGCETVLALPGSYPRATLPVGVKVAAGKVFWEWGGKRVTAAARIEGNVLICRVPPDVGPGEHLWLEIPSQAGTFWLDFITVEVAPDGGGDVSSNHGRF